MSIREQIHWHEGLFLQPHHLQRMQKNIYDQINAERQFYNPFPYGVIEAKISSDELENMRISFDRLHVIMPNGLEVHVPDNTDLPARDIKEAFAATQSALTVSLAVPLWYSNRANVVEQNTRDSWLVKRQFHVHEKEVPDENTGENPQPLELRRINARIILDNEDRTDMDCIPLLRIVHATGEELGFPRRDPNHVPPCMITEGSPVLKELIRDLTNQILASRKELVVQINRGGFSVDTMRGIQFEQMLRLRTLNRYSSKLGSLIQVTSGIPPYTYYLELRQLLAELVALHPENDRFEVRPYDHENLLACFVELSDSIRPLLKGAVQAKYLKVVFTRDEQEGILTAALDDQALTLPNEYFLAIKTKQDPGAVAQLVLDRDQFKLMPRSLASQRIFGVKLSQELYPPVELPAQVGLHYFRLSPSESARIWERIEQEKCLAIRWPSIETSDFEATLYMTIPQTEK